VSEAGPSVAARDGRDPARLGVIGHNVRMTTRHGRFALWGLMFLVVGWVAWTARVTLLPFMFGAFIAYALQPVVDRLAVLIPASTHRGDVLRRGLVVLLIYIAFFGSIIAAAFAVIPTAVRQATEFFDDLPDIIEDARVEFTAFVERYEGQLPSGVQNEIEQFSQNIGEIATDTAVHLLGGTVGTLTGSLSLIFGFLVVPFWMFYAMRDRHFVERNFMRAVPDSAKEDMLRVGRVVDYVFGRYIRAQLLLGLIVGVAVGVSMSLLGVKFPIGLGLWAGVTELIPFVGPWLGAAAGIVVVLATDPSLLIWVALIYLGIQLAENNLLVPRIQGSAVDIHPAMIIMLLTIVGSIWGFLGMLVAVPVAAIARELFWYADRRLRGESADEAFAATQVGKKRRDLPLDSKLHAPENIAAEDAVVAEGRSTPAEAKATAEKAEAEAEGEVVAVASTEGTAAPTSEGRGSEPLREVGG